MGEQFVPRCSNCGEEVARDSGFTLTIAVGRRSFRFDTLRCVGEWTNMVNEALQAPSHCSLCNEPIGTRTSTYLSHPGHVSGSVMVHSEPCAMELRELGWEITDAS